ncbi:MAG: methyltransferase [Verrucomicrobiota bacterium JB022]|nr:methyltransferase [Verrucomicrobiota bacterium JB022]
MSISAPTYDLQSCAVFGRTLGEYRRYFALDGILPHYSFLDVAAGSASFTAEAHELGYRARALDPAYAMNGRALRLRIQEDYERCIDRLKLSRAHFQAAADQTLQAAIQRRADARDRFLADFPAGQGMGRYLADGLPFTGLETGAFDYVLCGHFLFLYGHFEEFDYAFHLAAAQELARVARIEARIYPVIQMNSEPYPHLDALREALEGQGIASELRPVDYEFLRGANQMLVLRRENA